MSKETQEAQIEKIGGVTLKKDAADLLMPCSNQIRRYGWKLEVVETENEQLTGSFGEDIGYKGKLVVQYRKFGFGDGEEIVDESAEIMQLDSENSYSRKQLDGDDPNDIFTDRYFYGVDKKKLVEKSEDVVQEIRYREAGGNPDNDVWPITPEQLREHYSEYFRSKILVDGWSKSYDQSKTGNFEELTEDEVANAERVTATLASVLIRAKSEDSQPPVVTAGNTAGVQKLVSTHLEEANCHLLFALPESKDPNKYIAPSTTLVLQAPPQEGKASGWGDELVGEIGIASAEFGVRTVFLIGGGPNLEQQLPIYLDNVLKAQQENKMYVIAAVQGVGGVSSRERLFAALEQYAEDEKYRSLFSRGLNEEFLPDWLQILDANDEQLSTKIDELVFRTSSSDLF